MVERLHSPSQTIEYQQVCAISSPTAPDASEHALACKCRLFTALHHSRKHAKRSLTGAFTGDAFSHNAQSDDAGSLAGTCTELAG